MTLIIPQLTQIQAFTVAGVSVRTKNEDEFNPKTAQLPTLWERFFDLEANRAVKNGPIYGLYHQYEFDLSGYYTVTAGIDITNEAKTIYLDRISVEAGPYLVFEAHGPNPSAIIRAWQTIWDYFDKQPKWQRTYLTDFELYKTPNESSVYIGVLPLISPV